MLIHQQNLNKFFEKKIGVDFSYCVEILRKKDINYRKKQDNHGYGKVLSLEVGRNQLFQENFQKNPLEVTPILYMESNRHCLENLYAKGDK
jgi:hypothetical protein